MPKLPRLLLLAGLALVALCPALLRAADAANLEAGTDGKLSGHLLSLDQGSPPISIETLTEKDGAVRFDVPRICGGFEGKLNADGSELAGEWTQGSRSTPLVFKRLPAKS